MRSRKPFTTVAAVVFLVMAIVHVYRLIVPFAVTIGGASVPMWVSALAAVVTAGLSAMVWRESRS